MDSQHVESLVTRFLEDNDLKNHELPVYKTLIKKKQDWSCFFFINLINIIIPIVPPNDSLKPKSSKLYGLYNNMINADIEMFVYISAFLYNIFETSVKIAIIHALVTEGVKFVIAINIIKKNIQNTLAFLFPIIEFCVIYVNPIIM